MIKASPAGKEPGLEVLKREPAVTTLSLDALNSLAPEAFEETLGGVFEDTPTVARDVASLRPFTSIAHLHETMVAAVTASGSEEQTALIRRHPDLAGKLAKAGRLTESSTSEQASAGLDLLTQSEYEAFDRLNTAYRTKFGFPFIIAVRDHDKQGILAAFEARLEHDAESERSEALRQINRIAELRLINLLSE